MKRKSINSINLYGFTLMELMVTIVIAGIIVAFALPQYNVAIQRNRSQKAKMDAEIILMGLKHLRSVDNEYPVFAPAADIPISTVNSTLGIRLIDTDLIFDYTKNAVAGANYVKDFASFVIKPKPSWIASGAKNYFTYTAYDYTCTLDAGAPQSGLQDCHDTEAGSPITCSAPNATNPSENYCR